MSSKLACINLKNGVRDYVVFKKKLCLVGNSGALLGSNVGEKIDNFDGDIIRMNSSVVGGKFGNNVGTRCDVRFVCYNAVDDCLKWKVFDKMDGGKVIFWGSENNKKKVWLKIVKLCRGYGNIDFYEISRDVINSCDLMFQKFIGVNRKLSGSWLSTGWITLCSLLQIGCEIDVYGMFCHGEQLYHYWDIQRGNAGVHYREQQLGAKGHRFMSEHKVFVEKWTKIYKLKFIL